MSSWKYEYPIPRRAFESSIILKNQKIDFFQFSICHFGQNFWTRFWCTGPKYVTSFWRKLVEIKLGIFEGRKIWKSLTTNFQLAITGPELSTKNFEKSFRENQ